MIVSNTEVNSFNTCQRQHYYRFIMGYEPKHLSMALRRGLLGHEALDAYYTVLKNGDPVEMAFSAANAVLVDYMAKVIEESPEDFDTLAMIKKLDELLEAYSEHYRVEPFEVLEIEKVYTTPITDNIEYGLKLDLLIQFTAGPYRGDYAVMDNKFVYNFKTPEQYELDGQLPKYIKTLRENGIKLTKAFFNQLRYRPLKDPKPTDLFQRVKPSTTKVEIETVWEEQARTALEIDHVKTLGDEYKPKRALTYTACRNCFFQGPCMAELRGLDTTHMWQVDYQPNTYGYEPLTVEGE